MVVTDEAASHPHRSTPIFNKGFTSSQHPVIVDTIKVNPKYHIV